MTCILTGALVSSAAQHSSSEKPAIKPVDPESINLKKPTLFIAPYSHLDDVWRWSYPQVIREFLKNTLDDNFAAFEEYPHFVFNWSGAGRYAMMKEYYPEKYDELKEWVAAGRWFPCGSSWVENDVLVPSTESVIRQILMGRTYFYNEFGKESLEYMLPDCFGFPWSLPSVLSHCGIRGFSTQKLKKYKSANGIPFNVGRWIGPDGQWVIAALDPGNYAGAHTDVYTTSGNCLKRLRENRSSCGLQIDFFYMGGGDKNNADRGGSPQAVSLETLEKCYESRGQINVIAGPADLMVRAITDDQAEEFPTWEKDLLLTEHSTGVLTSQAYTKQLNRDSELLADAAERAAVSANLLTGAAYPSNALHFAWGLMLRNQFHDTLPGTSIPKAYEYAWNDGIIALNVFDGVYSDAIGALAGVLNTDVQGVPLVIYNPLSIARTDVVEALVPVELEQAAAITAYDANGTALPTQMTTGWDGKRRILFQADVPAVGASVYALRDETPPAVTESELKVDEDSLENARYKVEIDENGDIAGIFDKQLDRELLSDPAQLEFLNNFPEKKPAWHIDWKDVRTPANSRARKPTLRIVENGPVRIAIEVIRENKGSIIAQRIRLSAGADGSRVDVASRIDWKTPETLLKAAFHFEAKNPLATYSCGLGAIQRGNHNETQFEVPNHAWLDLTDSGGRYGVSLLTGSKYGSDKPDNNTLRITLLHSPGTHDGGDETRDTGHAREQRWQDWGRHEFTYALTAHKDDWRSGTPWEAQRFEQRLAAFAVPRHAGTAGSFSLLTVDQPQVIVQAVKRAENDSGVIVRLQELKGEERDDVMLSLNTPITAAEEMDGAERPLGKKLKLTDGNLKLNFKPWQIRTVLLTLPQPESKPLTVPVPLPCNCDVFSFNSNRNNGNFDGKNGTFPAEMIEDTVQLGNVLFAMGSRQDDATNAVACNGQTIDLPAGTTVVHLLAAADVDTPVVFKAGEKEIPLTIGGWSGYMGSWDNRVFDGEVSELSYSLVNDLKSITPAFIRNQRIAWCASHRHTPEGDTLYEYGYLFAYRLNIPDGATTLTLPNSPSVRIAAMSAGDEGRAVALQSPFEDLHRDEAFRERFSRVK